MKLQKDEYSCGAAAVVNALRCFGKKISERNVRVFSSTTPEKGTDEHGIIAGLRGFGVDGEVFETQNRKEAIANLKAQLRRGEPVIICTQNYQHWVTVVGIIGEMFIVSDPSHSKNNKSENGVHVYDGPALSRMWKARNGKLFGINCKLPS